MADFGVAHLSIRQADIHARTGNQSVGLGGAQLIVNRRVGRMDGVVFGAFTVTEAIQNHQDQGFGRGRHKIDSFRLMGSMEKGRDSKRWRAMRHGSSGCRRLGALCILPAFYRPGTSRCLPR